MRPGFIIGGVAVALLIIAALQWWPTDWSSADEAVVTTPADASQPTSQPTQTTPSGSLADPGATGATTSNLPPSPPAEVLPGLYESDELVKENLSTWSLPAALLQREDLLSRLSVVIANAADGNIPYRQISFLAPPEKFQVVRSGEKIYIDPASYQRYDTYLDTLEAVAPITMAEFLVRFDPLLVEALGLLGESRSPRELVQSVMTRLDRLPELGDQVELLQPKVVYEYANPVLEELAGFDKQVLRMGPANHARLKAYGDKLMQAYLAR